MGFNYLFWGILFSFFDFRIQGFDILPDIIGFILIFNGANKLVYISDRFSLAAKLAIPLIVLSIFDIYQRPRPMNGIDPHISILGMLLALVAGVLITIMFYQICKGIEEKAIELGFTELAIQSIGRWKFLLVFECSVVVVPYLAMTMLQLTGILLLLLFLFAITVLVLLMTLMKSAQNQFPDNLYL